MVAAIIIYILIGIVLMGISVIIGTISGWIDDGEALIIWVRFAILLAAVWPITVLIGILCLFCYGIYRLVDYAREKIEK